MRTSFILVIISVLLLVSCTREKVSGSSNAAQTKYPKIITAAHRADPRNEIPLIEVNTHFQGLSSMTGDILDFRLYSNGTVEFDDYPTNSLQAMGQIKAEEVSVRKQTRIAEGEMDVLKELLASNEFQELKVSYNKVGSSCDAVPQVIFKTAGKNIKIVWCDSLAMPYRYPEFPQILSILFRHFEDIKNGKYSDPPITD